MTVNSNEEYPPSRDDKRTAGKYPNTKFRVYDVYNRNVYEYDEKGVKSFRNW